MSKNDLVEFVKVIGALGFEVPRIYPIRDVHGLEVVDRGGAYFIGYGDELSQTFVKSVKKRLKTKLIDCSLYSVNKYNVKILLINRLKF